MSDFEFFVSLEPSPGVLSAMFGFLGKILDWYRKKMFSISNNLQENNKVVFFMIFYDFSRFSMVSLSNLLRKAIENLEKSWKIQLYFFLYFFWSWKNSFLKIFFPYQSRIFPGIQKSYLEHRAMILKIRKTQNPTFFTRISRFWLPVRDHPYIT